MDLVASVGGGTATGGRFRTEFLAPPNDAQNVPTLPENAFPVALNILS